MSKTEAEACVRFGVERCARLAVKEHVVKVRNLLHYRAARFYEY